MTIPERLDAAMGVVFNVENAAAGACGEPQNDDRALWLLGAQQIDGGPLSQLQVPPADADAAAPPELIPAPAQTNHLRARWKDSGPLSPSLCGKTGCFCFSLCSLEFFPVWRWCVSDWRLSGRRLRCSGRPWLPPSHGWFWAPTLAGFAGCSCPLTHVFPGVRGSGVNHTKAAVYISNGYVPFTTVIGKFVTCALAIGSGQSLGPEDPSLQMGAGIASLIGRSLRLSQEKLRLIAPVGAAAGLAAAFNAPISAVLFVIEEVIGTWSAGALGAIVLAAVSSVVTMRAFLGADSLFRVPPFRVASPAEMLAYVVLGIAGGGASLILLKLFVYFRPRYKHSRVGLSTFSQRRQGC